MYIAIRSVLTVVFLCCYGLLLSQKTSFDINNDIIKRIPNDVSIIGLGDPTHQESTITNYRIDLIRKLVHQKQYKIIAIEGNLLELYAAHVQFLKDGNSDHFKNAMYPMLNVKEMEALYAFVQLENKNGNSIKIVGFDPSYSGNTFVDVFKSELNKVTVLTDVEKEEFIKAIEKATISNLKAIFRNNKQVKRRINHFAEKVHNAYVPTNLDEMFFKQALKNVLALYADSGNSRRDVGMADNVEFLRKVYPNEKIILFGSSSHLIKNPKSINAVHNQKEVRLLGDELNKKFNKSYYFIAYTGLSGQKWRVWNKTKALPRPIENSIEKEIESRIKEEATFCTEFQNIGLNDTSSRFLGHYFYPLIIGDVMDMLVLIRNIQPAEILKQ